MQGLGAVRSATDRRLPERAGQPGAWSLRQAKADSATSLVGQDVEGGAVVTSAKGATSAKARR